MSKMSRKSNPGSWEKAFSRSASSKTKPPTFVSAKSQEVFHQKQIAGQTNCAFCSALNMAGYRIWTSAEFNDRARKFVDKHDFNTCQEPGDEEVEEEGDEEQVVNKYGALFHAIEANLPFGMKLEIVYSKTPPKGGCPTASRGCDIMLAFTGVHYYTMKKHHGVWHLLDSLRDSPVALAGEADKVVEAATLEYGAKFVWALVANVEPATAIAGAAPEATAAFIDSPGPVPAVSCSAEAHASAAADGGKGTAAVVASVRFKQQHPLEHTHS
jgi:hypothetical protein